MQFFKKLGTILLLFPLFLMISCGDGSSTSLKKNDLDQIEQPDDDGHGGGVIQKGTLSVNEEGVMITLSTEGEAFLILPAWISEGSGDIEPKVKILSKSLSGEPDKLIAGEFETTVTSSTKEIIHSLGKSALPSYEAAGNSILTYTLSWDEYEIEGSVSLFSIMPVVRAQILGSSKLLEGDSTIYRVLVSDFHSKQPVENAEVKLVLKKGEEQIFSGTAKTDEIGTAKIKVEVPAETEGNVTIKAEVRSHHGTQNLESDAEAERIEKILLTTEKPLYQPGQTINIRALSLKVPAKTPLADRDVTLDIIDPKGNKVFSKQGKTSGYGVFSTTFKLADLVNKGKYQIRAVVGTEKSVAAVKTVTVDEYRLPRFKVSFSSDKSFYLPGGKLTGTVDANYFYGKPVSGGKVEISAKTFDVDFTEFYNVTGILDNDGKYIFNLDIPTYITGSQLDQGEAAVYLDVTVTDNADHSQTINSRIKVVKDPFNITLVPETGRVVPGVSQNFYLILADHSGKPLAGSAEVSCGAEKSDVTVDEKGISKFSFSISGDCSWSVKALSGGVTVTRQFAFSEEKFDEFVLLFPEKHMYEVGDTLKLDVLAALRPDLTSPPLLPDRVYVDIIQNSQTRLTDVVELENGKGSYETVVDETMTGPLEIFAYYLDRDGNVIRDSSYVYVLKVSGLSVAISSDKEIYKPREEATVTFSVKDSEGNAAVSALGISIVDEAVFALAEYRAGMESTYFDIEQAVMKPTYVIYGIRPGDFNTIPEDDAKKTELDERAEAYLESNGPETMYGVSEDSYTPVFSSALSTANSFLKDKIQKAIESYMSDNNIQPESFDQAKLQKVLSDSSNFDPWGNELFGVIKDESYSRNAVVKSRGMDEIWNSSDDIEISVAIYEETWQDDVDAGDNGGEEPSDNGGGDKDEGGARKVRSWFPETLYFNPEFITDEKGEAKVELTMPDSITSWRITALANTLGGSLGSEEGALTVFQDFFVEIDLPVFLTQNDTVSVPVGIYNYLSESETVTLVAEDEDWFEKVGEGTVSVDVSANSVSAVYFPIKVLKPGVHTLTVYAQGSNLQDAIKRSVKVIPDGIPEEAVESDLLDGEKNISLTIPETAIDDSEELFVKIYPGIMSQAVEGLDSMFQMPTGCFEQTSSATYPNVLVLQYLIKTDQLKPEIELKARDYIAQGYQRLLTFEVEGGGFEWFGETPAHFVLTCFGMMEFIDMAKVHPVDQNLIDRTAQWMASQQNPDGSFKPSSGGIPEGAINNFQDSLLRTTAYAVWALSRAEKEMSAVQGGVNYLLSHLSEATDTYTKAITAMSLVSSGNAGNSAVAEFVNDLLAEKKDDGKGGYYWEQTVKTETYSSGDNAVLETTALIGLLLFEKGGHNDIVEGIISFLSRKKDSFGNWSTTQGTVLALRLMVASLDMAGSDASGQVTVAANGTGVADYQITADNADVLRLIDLKELLKKGENQITINFTGTGRLMYSAVARWYVPGDGGAPAEGPLKIDVQYDKSSLKVNDTVGVNVTVENISESNQSVILASIGLPPGFTLLTEKLDKMTETKDVLQRYEQTPRQLILYIKEIKAGQKVNIEYELLADFPIEASTGESSTNPYYNPESRSFAPGEKIVVEE